MMGHKGLTKKMRLAKAERQNKRLPVFVTIRTKRKVQANNKRRTWRTDKLRIKE
ncbi:TPA: 50S ribosomal protein L39e [Candidatus Micrarchaeota archaeon]|nr:50S ribosomal protein L39e [Candidatus Micrarchaeota archaeon]